MGAASPLLARCARSGSLAALARSLRVVGSRGWRKIDFLRHGGGTPPYPPPYGYTMIFAEKWEKCIFFSFFCQKICIYQKKVVPLHRN